MNPRQRFLQTLGSGNPDRVPYHDREIRDDVVERWRKEGLPPGVSVEEHFGLEHWELIGPREQLRFNITPVPDFQGTLGSRADFDRLKQAYDPSTPGRSWISSRRRANGLLASSFGTVISPMDARMARAAAANDWPAGA